MLDSGPLRRCRRNFLVYVITQKWINIFFKLGTHVKDAQWKIPIMSEIDPDNISYHLPEVMEESSSNDPTLVIVPGSLHLTYTVVPSGTKRDKNKVIDTMGYTYNLFRKTSAYSKNWQCTVRGKKLRCRATVNPFYCRTTYISETVRCRS